MNKPAVAADSQTKDKTNDKPSTKRIRDDKPRKKEDKSVEHVLKALNSLDTTEEKLAALCQKYAEMFNDHRLLQNAAKQAERRNGMLQKEKEQLQAEHSKAVLTRSRLENLCRELQRQNKAVKEECMLKMREEGEKKREVAAKFHSMLSEIGSLLAQNNDKNAKLRDDNLDMSARLKSVCDQFEKKEQHVENLAKQMQLEMQLAEAKLAKARMEMDIEKETLQKEKQQLLIELADYKRKLCEMKASELALKEQIQVYSDKYEEFHKALLQSNGAIGDFKAEMERMTKHIRRLEKETATWKTRYDSAQGSLARVTEDKIRSEEARALSDRRLCALQGLCRRLQDHCKQLRDEKTIDSQTDEAYRNLQEQIKEVERSAMGGSLDNGPCPRRVSVEREKGGGDHEVQRSAEMREELSSNSGSGNVEQEVAEVAAPESTAEVLKCGEGTAPEGTAEGAATEGTTERLKSAESTAPESTAEGAATECTTERLKSAEDAAPEGTAEVAATEGTTERLKSAEDTAPESTAEVAATEGTTQRLKSAEDTAPESTAECPRTSVGKDAGATEEVTTDQQNADHNKNSPAQGDQCAEEKTDEVLGCASISKESPSNTEVISESSVACTPLENGQISGDLSQSELQTSERTKEIEEGPEKTEVIIELNRAEGINHQSKAVNEENNQGSATQDVDNISKSISELANSSSHTNNTERVACDVLVPSETLKNTLNMKEGSPTAGGCSSERLTDSDGTLSKTTSCTDRLVVSSPDGESHPSVDCAAPNGNCLNNKNKKKKKGKK